MREYLYLDEQRITAYHDQISSPVTYDKVPTWKFSIGLTNTGVEGTQTRFARDVTLHEKLDKVITHLRTAGLLMHGRPSTRNRAAGVFGHETLNARKLRLPKAEPPICLWFSDDLVASALDPSEDPRACPGKAIFLIQDDHTDDPLGRGSLSGYSSLMLLYNSVSDIPGTTLNMSLGKFSNRVSMSPLDALLSMGAESGQSQPVEVIYRLRVDCFAEEDSFKSSTTVGYPIAIWTG